MKKLSFLSVFVVLALMVCISTGCDNRSQLEKDADKAASDLKKKLN